MTAGDSNIQTALDADGVLLATIDMPGRAMNVFSRGLMDSLEALIDRVESDVAVKALVLTSGKGAFLAGADLDMIRVFTERARTDSFEALHELCGHLGRLFRRLERVPKPTVAAINGLALGGGLEVCMACHSRVVANDEKIQLGLPEIKLGLLPGAGGTQRLPRLVGTAKGMQMLLTGEPVTPQQALTLGLVDAVVPADELIAAAKRLALSGSRTVAAWDQPKTGFASTPFDFEQPGVFDTIADAVGISADQRAKYPAYNAIIDCVVGGWQLPITEASHREMDIFVELIRDPVAGNMVRTLFLNRQKAAKLGLLAKDSPLSVGDDALLPRMKAAIGNARAAGCDDEEILLAGAFAAVRSWADGKIDQPELADVAAVNAGLYPAYTGGPFNYVRQCGPEHLRARTAAAAKKTAALFEWHPAIERLAAGAAA